MPKRADGMSSLLAPAAAVLILLAPLSDRGVLLIGLILAALITAKTFVPMPETEASGLPGEIGVGRDRSP
jgi:hypothetical protein